MSYASTRQDFGDRAGLAFAVRSAYSALGTEHHVPPRMFKNNELAEISLSVEAEQPIIRRIIFRQ